MSSEVEAGWYPDPEGKPCDRYWDGEEWTSRTRPHQELAPKKKKLVARKTDPKRQGSISRWFMGQILNSVSAAVLALLALVASFQFPYPFLYFFFFGVPAFVLLSFLALTRYAKVVAPLLTWWYVVVVLSTLLSRPNVPAFRSDFDRWGFLVPLVYVAVAWIGFSLLWNQRAKPTRQRLTKVRKITTSASLVAAISLLGLYLLVAAPQLAPMFRSSDFRESSGGDAQISISSFATNEREFLTYVKDLSTLIQERSIPDENLIDIGRSICRIYDNNGTSEDVADAMFPYIIEYGFAESAIFTSALTVGATQYLCPNNISKVSAN